MSKRTFFLVILVITMSLSVGMGYTQELRSLNARSKATVPETDTREALQRTSMDNKKEAVEVQPQEMKVEMNSRLMRRNPEMATPIVAQKTPTLPFRGDDSPVLYTTSEFLSPGVYTTTLGQPEGNHLQLTPISSSYQAMEVVDDVGYVVTYEYNIYGGWNTFGTLDIETGAYTQISDDSSVPDAISMAYNPIDGEVYVSQWMAPFGKINLETGEFTQIVPTSDNYIITIDNDGVCYAIQMFYSTSFFGTINLTTGVFTPIATYDALWYVQDLSVDRETNEIYHFCVFDMYGGETILRKINKADGTYTTIGNYELTVESAVIMEGPGDTGAPAEITDFTVTPGTSGALTAALEWTNPTLTTSGDPLITITAVNIYENDGETPIHTIDNPAPGSEGTYNITSGLIAGLYKWTVVPENAEGEGPPASVTVWIGPDVPAEPTEVILVNNDMTAYLSWTAPTTGLNGGYFTTAGLVYDVYRMPDNVLISTNQTENTFTELITQPGTYYYNVVAKNESGTGGIGESNPVSFGIPIIEVTPQPVEIGTIYNNLQYGTEKLVAIKNVGGGTLNVTSYNNTTNPEITVVGLPIAVGPESTGYVLFVVNGAGLPTGAYTGTVVLNSDCINNPEYIVNISGTVAFEPEIFQFEVTIAAVNTSFNIPICGSLNEIYNKPYNWNIEWGDGQQQTIANTDSGAPQNSPATGIPHTYSDAGTYTITITPNGSTDAWLAVFGFDIHEIGASSQDNKDMVTKVKSAITPLMTRTQTQINTGTAPDNREWSDTFYGCTNLTMGDFFSFNNDWNNITTAGVYFAMNMFRNCSGANFTMNEIFNLPSGLTTVESAFAYGMFFNCHGENFTMNEVFNLPPEITSVGFAGFAREMFISCSGANFNMNEVFNLPTGITTVGGYFASGMFYNCSGSAFTMNEIFNLPSEITTTSIQFARQMFMHCNGENFTMNEVFNLPTGITEAIDGFALGMFRNCNGAAFTMNEVFNLPSGITTVKSDFAWRMFYNCSGENFTMNEVFNFPTGITSTERTFASEMFSNCTGANFTMNEVFNLPSGINTVKPDFASEMFKNCFGSAFTMNEVFNLPSGITTVENFFVTEMFSYCFGDAFTMNEVFNLPAGITTVGTDFASGMFYNCSGSAFNMNEVFNLPSGISTVGTDFTSGMFYNCSGASFKVNNIFKFPVLSQTELNKGNVFDHTFYSLGDASSQIRTATSIINGNHAPSVARQTFSNSSSFADLEYVHINWGGDAYQIEFVVKDVYTQAPILDADILFDGDAGYLHYRLTGTYSYSVSKTDYESVQGTKEITADTVIEVLLEPTTVPLFTVTFDIYEANQPTNKISGATVTFDGVTSAPNVYTIQNVLPGLKTWSVEHDDYEIENGSTNITGDITIPVGMTAKGAIRGNSIGDIILYPNPFDNEIFINSKNSVVNIQIFNAMGQKVKDEVFNNNPINTSNLGSGVYFMIIENSSGEKLVYKMVKK